MALLRGDRINISQHPALQDKNFACGWLKQVFIIDTLSKRHASKTSPNKEMIEESRKRCFRFATLNERYRIRVTRYWIATYIAFLLIYDRFMSNFLHFKRKKCDTRRMVLLKNPLKR